MAGTYLYTYENRQWKPPSVYVGIGDSLDRPWGPHNAEATALRKAHDTEVLHTPEPFSTRKDARAAEAIAIRMAAFSGFRVLSDHPDTEEILMAVTTNLAGTRSTKHLVPAVAQRPGSVSYWSLERTAIVTLKPDAIGSRPTLHSGRSVTTFAERAQTEWPLTTALRKNYGPRRLLAILKGRHTIVGDWDLEVEPITEDGLGFQFRSAMDDDPRRIKFMRLDLDGARLGNLVTWSEDIRKEFLR